MSNYRPRAPSQPPLKELRALRMKKFPRMVQKEFAENELGISRLHLIAVEQGRRLPSRQLLLRWLAALAPEATLDMFGDVVFQERAGKFTKKEARPATSQAA